MNLFKKLFKKEVEESCGCGSSCCGSDNKVEETSCCCTDSNDTQDSCCSTETNTTHNHDDEEYALCDCGSMCKVSEIEAKKKEETKGCCDTSKDDFIKASNMTQNNNNIKVLGSGCAKCNQLEQNTISALKSLNMDTTIEHVTDFAQIASYGVMTTPALIIDGTVASYGKVLSEQEVIELLKKIRG